MKKSIFEWLKQHEDAIVKMQECVRDPSPILDNADYMLALTKYAEAYKNIVELGLAGSRALEKEGGEHKLYSFKRTPGGEA